jgi:hypothetical protein
MVRGFAGGVKPQKRFDEEKGIAKGTLLFPGLGLTNVRQKSRMRRPKLGVIAARLVQAQLAVHREPDFGGVRIFLAVIFPPANRTKPQSAGRIERFVPATGTAIANFNRSAHTGIRRQKPRRGLRARRHGVASLFPIWRKRKITQFGNRRTRAEYYFFGVLFSRVYEGPGDVAVSVPTTLPLESTQ